MTILLTIILVLMSLSNWGLWSRLHDLHREMFDLRYPDLTDKEEIIASYLGSIDHD